MHFIEHIQHNKIKTQHIPRKCNVYKVDSKLTLYLFISFSSIFHSLTVHIKQSKIRRQLFPRKCGLYPGHSKFFAVGSCSYYFQE